ncbi:hypothetical protein MRX96_030732 [Rhipicephalus microplus]
MKAPGLEDAKKLRIALIAGNEPLERDDFLSVIARLWPWGQLGAQKQAWLSFLPLAAPVQPAAVPVCAVAKSLAAAARALLYDALPQSAGFSSGDTAHRVMPDGRSHRMCVVEGMKARRQNLAAVYKCAQKPNIYLSISGMTRWTQSETHELIIFPPPRQMARETDRKCGDTKGRALRMLAKDERSSRLRLV